MFGDFSASFRYAPLRTYNPKELIYCERKSLQISRFALVGLIHCSGCYASIGELADFLRFALS